MCEKRHREGMRSEDAVVGKGREAFLGTSVQPSKAEAVNIMLKPVCIDFSNVLRRSALQVN